MSECKLTGSKILSGVILITIIIGVGIHLLQKNNVPAENDQIAVVVEDEYNDWETFSNENLGYSIKYPANLVLTEITKEGENDYQLQAICFSGEVLMEGAGPNCMSSVGVHKATLAEEINNFGEVDQKEIMIAGEKATEISYNGEMDGRALVTVMIPLNDYVYAITYSPEIKDDEILEKMLESFEVFVLK